jgi:hypothetical protein
MNALRSLAELTTLYLQSEPTFMKDEADLATFSDFTAQVDIFLDQKEPYNSGHDE